MADNLKKAPKKGILKNSSSFETVEREKELSKETKWDEMNIIATYHPKDKDYGHMKIEEPKTPYSYADQSGDDIVGLDAEFLAERIQLDGNQLPSAVIQPEEESSEEEENESPEEKEKRKVFEMKRKQHYNEYAAVKLARKLMEEDEDNEVDLKLPEESDSETENEKNELVTKEINTDSRNPG